MKTTKRIDSRPRGVLGVSAVLASLAAAGVLAAVGLAQGPTAGTDTTTTTTTTVTTKIVICHKTHSTKHPQVTITVSQSAWKAHQRHGDTLGACTPPTTTTTTTTNSTGTTTTAAASPGKSGEQHGNSGVNGQHNGHG
jgi:hypothetical protein